MASGDYLVPEAAWGEGFPESIDGPGLVSILVEGGGAAEIAARRLAKETDASAATLAEAVTALQTDETAAGPLLPPIDPHQEVWACGVTYLRSRVAREEAGVVVVLREQESSRELMEAIERVAGRSEAPGDVSSGDIVLRTYGVGAQILRDLGLTRIRVLSAPKNMYAISGFDLEITEYV